MNFSALMGEPFVQAFLFTLVAAYSQYVVLRAGVFSIATVGFVCIGAYCTGILMAKHMVPAVIAVIASVVLNILVGLVLGRIIQKLRGAYQAIATLSFVMIVQVGAFAWTSLTGGFQGLIGVPFWATTMWLLVIVVAVIITCVAMELGTIGRRQRAAFHDEVAAASVGIDVARSHLIAVVVSAALGGLSGAAMAGNQLVVDSTTYGFLLVITVQSAVIIGGTRSFLGPIIGTFVVLALPLLFSRYSTLSSVVVAVMTLIIMVFLPKGVVQAIPFDSAWVFRKLRGPPRTDDASVGSVSTQFLKAWPASDRLVVDDVVRHFGAVKAVDHLSVEVDLGQIVGLIGPNGAGKTTVMNLVAGLAALDSGKVMIGGQHLEQLPAFQVERAGIARTFQTCRLFAEATVWENVLLAAETGRDRNRRRQFDDASCATAALKLADCIDDAERIATGLPYTNQRRAELARALATEPRFILLDEPAAGMPDAEAEHLAAIVRRIAAHNVGVIVIDHNVSWICSISDRVIVQNFGQVIADGSPKSIMSNPKVVEAYLGAPDEVEAHPAGVA